MSDLFAKLAAPFPPDRVSWRVGSINREKTKAMALAYIDARDVMGRLDDVCGPAGWQNRYTHAEKKTVCEIGIKAGDEWIWKADGAGESDIEAEKGALSDAFKRCAVRWGIGRYLYDLPSPWVEIDEHKRIKPEALKRLETLLQGKATMARIDAAPEDPEKTGLFIACRAAIDMADENDGKTGLELWAKDNTASMTNMEKEYPEVYKAVKRHYASKLKPHLPARQAA